MQLSSSQYGKSSVGLLKVFRDGAFQTVKEIKVSVLASGDFERAFRSGDNSTTVPTDTIKNTVYALAKDHLQNCLEDFGLFLADHFLGKYPSFESVSIELEEKPWERLIVDGGPHPHSFQRGVGGVRTAKIEANREGRTVHAGIQEWEILKSTGSGFVGYPKCEFTTLPETEDRILATRVQASWRYDGEVDDFNHAHQQVIEAFTAVFAKGYSHAVQETLFRMGTVAIETVPAIAEVSLRLPNVHFFAYDLDRFGIENGNTIFYPAAEPYGDIAATVSR